MDNAIIILAHGDIDNLRALIGYFDSQCDIFVHIDKKFHVKDDTIKDIRRQAHVKGVYNHISVHWGGNSILDCELFMLREASRLSDANPYTPQLSKLILPPSDIPCEVADISEKIDGDVQYDIVLCLDVLTYIPKQRFSESISNLLKICNRSLVVSLNSEYMSVPEYNDMLSQATLNGFYFSHALSVMFKDNDKPAMEYFIFERHQA